MFFSFAISIVAIYVFEAFCMPYVDTFFITGNNSQLVVNGVSNSFHYWSLDPLSSLVNRPIPNFIVPLFACGMNYWIRNYSSSRIALFLSLGTTLSVLSFFGYDSTLWSSIVWFPFCFALFDKVLISGSVAGRNGLVSLIFLYLTSRGAHELTLFILIIWFGFQMFRVSSDQMRPFGILAIASIFFSVKELWFFEAPPFPNYPPFSRVLWPIYPHLDPSVGPHLPIPILDRESLKLIFLPFGCVLMGLGGLSFVLKHQKQYSLLIFIFGSALIWDSFHFPPEGVGEIGPLAAISRIVAGLSFHSLGYVLCAISFLFLPFLALSIRKSIVFAISGAFFLFLAIYLTRPLLLSERAQQLISNMQGTPEVLRVGLSPSFSLIKNGESGIFSLREKTERISKRKLSRFAHSLSASHNMENLNRINSTELGQRWTSGGGMQKGGEWVHIYFDEPQEIEGLKVTTGWYSGDFPRGVQITGSPTCIKSDNYNFDGYEEYFNKLPWQGAIQFTADGFPFIEPRHLGTFLFPSKQKVQCLLLKQTGSEPRLDWSVSEIYILAQKK